MTILGWSPLRHNRNVGDQWSIYDRRFEKCCNAVTGTAIKHWPPCGAKRSCSMPCMHESTDSPFVQFHDEVNYAPCLSPIIARHAVIADRSFSTSPSEALGFSLCFLLLCLFVIRCYFSSFLIHFKNNLTFLYVTWQVHLTSSTYALTKALSFLAIS